MSHFLLLILVWECKVLQKYRSKNMFKFFKNDEENIQKKWKEKAKERGQEIKRLKKQIKEISKSKNKWKDKAESFKLRNKIIEDILKKND